MPRDFRHSHSRSPRRSRSPPRRDRLNGNVAYRDDRRGNGIDDMTRYERYDRSRRSASRGYGSNGSEKFDRYRDFDTIVNRHREQSIRDHSFDRHREHSYDRDRDRYRDDDMDGSDQCRSECFIFCFLFSLIYFTLI